MKYILNFIFFILPKFKFQFLLFFIFAFLAITFEMLSIAVIIPILNFFVLDSNSLFDGKVSFILDWFKNFKIVKYEILIIYFITIAYILKNSFIIFYQIWQSVFVLKIERFLASQLFSKYLKKIWNFICQYILAH